MSYITDSHPENASHLPGGVPGSDGRVAHPRTLSRWFALRTRSRFEFAVSAALEAQGTERFLPTWSETTRWTDRTNQTTRPLFAGYIFARFDPLDRAAILSTRGVVQILSIDSQPNPISDDEIASIRAVVDSPAAFERVPYVAGSMVRVERGPFAGVSGIVTRTQGTTTLTIPVTILGRAVAVQIDAADVKAA